MEQYGNFVYPFSTDARNGSLEMLRLTCEQIQKNTAPMNRSSSVESKNVEVICSVYDKMSETEALEMLKKKILKDTTTCHLWMFLFDILMDSKLANVATWEDQKGMFRIRDPTKLADMWGEKRNRTNMTYEKLSRSLRHYYEKKILRKVPKRKYTYKFNSKEILKSYEVQPFYRRTNAQRNTRNQTQGAQGTIAVKPSFQPQTSLPNLPKQNQVLQQSAAQNIYQPNWSIKGEPLPQLPERLSVNFTAQMNAESTWNFFNSLEGSLYGQTAQIHNQTTAQVNQPNYPQTPNIHTGQPYSMVHVKQELPLEFYPATEYGKRPLTSSISVPQHIAYPSAYSGNMQGFRGRTQSLDTESYQSSSPESFLENDINFDDLLDSIFF